MHGIFRALITLALAISANGAFANDLSTSDAAALRQAETRGALIYAYDQAAWHGTDDFRLKAASMRPEPGGWIVDGPADAPELVFIDRNTTDPKALYIADFKNGKLVNGKILGDGDDRSLTPARKQMVEALRIARQTIGEAKLTPGTKAPFNTVVLPPEIPGGPTLVYFLTSQTELKTIPFGGHYLVPVAADGKAGSIRAFTKSCINLPFPASGKARISGTPAAITITHLLDPTPTEIHVFSAAAARLPVLVATSDHRLWEVLPNGIKFLTTLEEKKP